MWIESDVLVECLAKAMKKYNPPSFKNLRAFVVSELHLCDLHSSRSVRPAPGSFHCEYSVVAENYNTT